MARMRTWSFSVSLAAFFLVASYADSEPLQSRGIAAIRTGTTHGPVRKFQGTAFHLGNGWFATAAHVIDNIPPAFDGNFHIVVAAYEGTQNAVAVQSLVSCDDELDICFFRVDPANAMIRNDEFAEKFEPVCVLPSDPNLKLSTYGFSGEVNGLKRVDDGDIGYGIQSSLADFESDTGRTYHNVIVTGAPTSPGLSGSPVLVSLGTRKVIGVHTGFSDDTKNQVVTPFYNLDGPVQVGGEIVLDCTRPDPPTPTVLTGAESLQEILGACRTSRKIEIDADLEGSIETIFNGQSTVGNLRYIDVDAFLMAIPDEQKLAAYKVYTQCLLRLMDQAG